MASTVPRQPFAPLDGSRLQNLTSLKNRQNAFSSGPSKRKAESIDNDDSENVDPVIFSKRTKGSDSFFSNDYFKPSSFVLTKAPAPSLPKPSPVPSYPTLNRTKHAGISKPRSIIKPRSPVSKINTAHPAAAPLSAPAGRSPTRSSKRVGILSKNRRKTASPFTRVDPPTFGLGAGAPFSLDAALKGTVSSYASRSAAAAAPSSSLLGDLYGAELDGSWNFEIHEDTPEQEMTNLLQHSTCVLDISSDEESEQKRRRETAEGRDKENIPPVDDISQTTSSSARRRDLDGDDMIYEKTRGPLSEMNVADYYAAGCHSGSVIIVPGDYDDAETVHGGDEYQEPESNVAGDVAPKVAPKNKGPETEASIDELMGKRNAPAPQAALLQPIEGTGESFELWESNSAKDEAEPIAPSTPSAPTEEAVAQAEASTEAEVADPVPAC
ncbi:hypothetical protein RB597_000166 [Gaeumannomyces tritici]